MKFDLARRQIRARARCVRNFKLIIFSFFKYHCCSKHAPQFLPQFNIKKVHTCTYEKKRANQKHHDSTKIITKTLRHRIYLYKFIYMIIYIRIYIYTSLWMRDLLNSALRNS